MASVTNYSGYNQASAQQAYGSYAAQPAQGYGQTAQQGYSQQDYSSYGQPAATESAYGQTAAAAGGYTQQQYGASYGQSAAPAAYGTPQAGAQGYTQSAQGYGTSGYASSAAAPAAQASYSGQQSYGAQTAYSSYSQQPAASAPQSAYGASTQASYTQAGYAQPQAGYQGQQAGYAGQQQAAYGAPQQAQSAGFPQQPNGSYGQHAAPQSYDQYSGYSQGGVSGGYSGSQQPPSRGGYPGAGDSPGPGRDSFDRGGMRGGPRGRAPMGRGGMGVPAIVILGLSLTPCGWIMVLTSMVVPHWRTVHNITGKDPDLILWQGLWDICHYYLDSADMVCNNQDEAYFDHRIIDTAQRMMAFSLLLTLIGLAVTVFGVRCWTVRPKWTAVCLGGFVIVCSGLLSIMPVAWYGHLLNDIDSPSPEVRLGFCIIFGYLGGILEVLGGFLLFVATWRYNGNGLNPSLSPQTENHQNLWQITVPSVTGGVGNNCSNPKQSLENNM